MIKEQISLIMETNSLKLVQIEANVDFLREEQSKLFEISRERNNLYVKM